MTCMVGEALGSYEFLGSSSAGSFRRQMQHAIDSRLRCCHNSADFGITEVGPSNPGVTQSSFFTKRAIEYVLLPRKTTDELVDAYWELVYPPHPFLDRYALENCHESVWTGSGTTADDIALLCIMNVTFALGAQLSGIIEPERRREKVHIYFVRAESIRENQRKNEGLVLCALGGKGINEPWENGARTDKGLIA